MDQPETWTVDRTGLAPMIRDACKRPVAIVYRDADAGTIAAAPRMRALLQRIMETHDDDSGYLAEWRTILRAIEEARRG